MEYKSLPSGLHNVESDLMYVELLLGAGVLLTM